MSGGLPHSEIEGSKPITGSPSLIAGYHVLHRLLLPRHPPNALIALDLIQKEPNCAAYRYARLQSEQGLLCPLFHNLNQKLVHFPLLTSWIRNIWLVVLDLDSLMSCNPKVAGLPPLGTTDMTLMCISLNDVKRDPEDHLRPIGRSNLRVAGLMIKSCLQPQRPFGARAMVEPRRIELLTS